MKTISELQNKAKNSITVKVIVIGIMVLILLIPMGMIKNLVQEREFTRDNVINEISEKWGNPQTLIGPILNIPFEEKFYTDGNVNSVRKYAHILPDELTVVGNMLPEERYRGIYKTIVYSANIQIKGVFCFSKVDLPDAGNISIYWEKAFLSYGIPDMRGIQNELVITWNGSDYPVKPGTESNDVIHSGFNSKVKVKPVNNSESNYNFSFKLSLDGSKRLYFVPVGKITEINISSTWNNPSFDGAFLPDNRKIDGRGFTGEFGISDFLYLIGLSFRTDRFQLCVFDFKCCYYSINNKLCLWDL